MTKSLINLIPYVLALGAIVLGLVDFFRKREEYKDKRLRRVVLTILSIMGVPTVVSLRLDKNEKEQKDKRGEEALNTLQHKVDSATTAESTAIQDQKNNTTQFLTKFGQLSAEVNELKQQVTTAELQKKLASVQAELQKTQKAMAPAPKAKLTFTFFPFINPTLREDQTSFAPVVPVTEVKLPVTADGSVHVEFAVLNLTKANALDIALTLAICDGCKFAKEPEGFTRQPDLPDTDRWRAITAIHASEHVLMSVDIIPSPTMTNFKIGIQYRCDTCTLDEIPTLGTIHLMRDFLNFNFKFKPETSPR